MPTSACPDLLRPLTFACIPRLLQTVSYEHAQQLLAAEELVFRAIATDEPGSKAQDAGLSFLAYLQSTWMPQVMWTSWSRKGREDAARRMGIPFENVLPTTNHLEAFNGSLKKTHLPQWQHSGSRLRFDLLIYHLTVNILPRVYGRHRMLTGYRSWKSERFRSAAGGKSLHAEGIPDTHLAAGSHASLTDAESRPWYWHQPDERRDADAAIILRRNLIQPIPALVPYELWAVCSSSSVVAETFSSPPSLYSLTCHPSGSATCTCQDWLRRGGSCKHLRAFKIIIDSWSAHGALAYKFSSPASREEAIQLDQQNRLWYGPHYDRSVTQAATAFPTGERELSRNKLCLSSDRFFLLVASNAQTAPQPCPIILPPRTMGDSVASLEHELRLLEGVDSGEFNIQSICGPSL